MRDVDWNDKSNSTARRSNVTCWLNFHVVLEGPFVSGRAADGSDLPFPEKLSAYQPWKLFLSEDENKKAVVKSKTMDKRAKASHDVSSSQNIEVETSGVKIMGKAKNQPKKPVSKSSSRKRKELDPSSSPESEDDDFLISEDPSTSSSMKYLSSLFSDTMSAINNDELQRTFEMVSKVCDAPILDNPSLRGAASAIKPSFQYALGSMVSRLSYAVSSDYQRKLLKLKGENTKLKA